MTQEQYEELRDNLGAIENKIIELHRYIQSIGLCTHENR